MSDERRRYFRIEDEIILCYAMVVDCVALEKSSHYRMNVDFVTMRDEDTERLVQHIMRKEVEFLRTRRKSRQND